MSVGVPDWAEWWDDGVKQYISGAEYDRIKAFEPWRLSRIVSISQFKNEEQGGVSRSQVLKDSKKGYNDYPYIRSKVVNREIIEAVREVLGVKEGEAIPLVFDGKVTPVVVLNDSIKYSSYKLLGVYDYSGWVNSPSYIMVYNNGDLWAGNNNHISMVDKNLVLKLDLDNTYMNNDYLYNMGNKSIVALIDDNGMHHVLLLYRNGIKLCEIDCGDNFGYYVVSNNGKYVILWDNINTKFYFYEGVV